jgi:broad specificity phosphatase PhoE
LSIKKVYLIRHGQTDFNLKNIVQGSGVNTALNETGHRQAALFFKAYGHIPFDKVYTSSLLRSIESVQGFLNMGLPHEQHSALNEINWGDREGTRITPEEDLYYHNMLATWRKGHTHIAIGGGESPEDVAKRQKPFIDLLLSRPEEQNVLICMHGRAIRILLCLLLNYPLRCMDAFIHQNLGLYQLDFTGSMFSVNKYCQTDHLESLEL